MFRLLSILILLLLGCSREPTPGLTNSPPVQPVVDSPVDMSHYTNIIIAITALVAVIVGPLISVYIARKQIRASVVSANRHVWINNLRDTISEYLAKQHMVRTLNIQSYADKSSLPRIEEVIRLHGRIELLINPKEADHSELVEEICRISNTLNQSAEKNKDFDMDAHRESVVKLSQAILKREWERIKAGE